MLPWRFTLERILIMRLTKWTDYTLRVLMHCAATRHRATPVTISEIAERHDISRSHLMKIVMTLSSLGWIESIRGRGGGIRLLVDATQLSIGEVLRQTETDFDMVECFDEANNTCRLNGRCRLKHVLEEATESYMRVLDGVHLADLLPSPNAANTHPLKRLLV
jgi:Rrf2 family nitric oxide-sensitive transcriptional repressor